MDVNDFVDEVRSIAEKAKLDIPEFNLEVGLWDSTQQIRAFTKSIPLKSSSNFT